MTENEEWEFYCKLTKNMNWFEIRDLINRKQRQILVHSYIYYVLDKNIIDDTTWSEWAEQLEILMKCAPEEAAGSEFHMYFEDFDHSTGANLVKYYDDERLAWVPYVANMLLWYENGGK